MPLPKGYRAKARGCQVDGCYNPFPADRAYYKRYRICEEHSVSPFQIFNSQPCRWCQQCAHFEPLAKFEGAKRSCRRKLEMQKARRNRAKDAGSADKGAHVTSTKPSVGVPSCSPEVLEALQSDLDSLMPSSSSAKSADSRQIVALEPIVTLRTPPSCDFVQNATVEETLSSGDDNTVPKVKRAPLRARASKLSPGAGEGTKFELNTPAIAARWAATDDDANLAHFAVPSSPLDALTSASVGPLVPPADPHSGLIGELDEVLDMINTYFDMINTYLALPLFPHCFGDE